MIYINLNIFHILVTSLSRHYLLACHSDSVVAAVADRMESMSAALVAAVQIFDYALAETSYLQSTILPFDL